MVETASPSSIKFKVRRGRTELVTPAKPTPYEFKTLSDFDWMKVQVSLIWFYGHNPSLNGVDPAKLIRNAIAETLVFYYPFAGRLRESPTGKLTVECTGEGILFTEADADVTLDQFGYPIVPPFPCSDQLLYEEPGSGDILNSPLALIQVTRLKCGGFICSFRLNHVISDASGEAQFMCAIGEMARGATSPSVLPVWDRHLVSHKNLPLAKRNHDVSESNNTNNPNFPLELCYKSFIFRPVEISALRRCLPLHLRHCSTFEVLTAAIWKCRVAAFQPDWSKDETTTFYWPVNLRNTKLNHFIPSGYYGNALGYSMTTSPAKEILKNPLSYTLQLLRNGKETIYNDELNRESSIKDAYSVSDLRHIGFDDVDFGWGKPLLGGFILLMPTYGGYLNLNKRNKSELDGILFPFCLPKQEMERFEMELNNMLKEQTFTDDDDIIKSRL